MTTRDYSALQVLSAAQVEALEILEAGGSHAEAAAAAGVHRVTVSKWATRHPGFIAETNRRRAARADRLSVRVDSVTLSALDVVAQACAEGDRAAALSWLRLVGLAGVVEGERRRAHSSPVHAAEILDDAAEAERLRGAWLRSDDRKRLAREILTDLNAGSADS